MKTRRSWLATVSGAAASARGGALLCVVAQHGAHGDDSLSTLTTELFQRAFVPLRGECATGRFFLPLPLTCTCMFVRVTDSLQIWYVAGCCAANCTTVIRNSSLSIANRSTTMTITMALLDDAVTQMSQALPHIHQRYNMVSFVYGVAAALSSTPRKQTLSDNSILFCTRLERNNRCGTNDFRCWTRNYHQKRCCLRARQLPRCSLANHSVFCRQRAMIWMR